MQGFLKKTTIRFLFIFIILHCLTAKADNFDMFNPAVKGFVLGDDELKIDLGVGAYLGEYYPNLDDKEKSYCIDINNTYHKKLSPKLSFKMDVETTLSFKYLSDS